MDVLPGSPGAVRSALIVVDMQPDFMPGGALAVAGGDTVVAGIAAAMESERFDLVVATQDWHPPRHVSFASMHPGRAPFDVIDLYGHEQVLWPDHCVQQTPGAALTAGLPWGRVRAIVRKGADPGVDSYSAFQNNWNADGDRPPTGLAGMLRELGIGRVVLCGLARDYCVKWSAEDAAAAGFDTAVLWDLTRPVDPTADAALARGLIERGIELIEGAAGT